MSEPSKVDKKCPKCNEMMEVRVQNYVETNSTASTRSTFERMIRELFWECPKCHHRIPIP